MAASLDGPYLLWLLTVFIITFLTNSGEGKSCIDHFSIEGIEEDGIVRKGNTLTVTYYVNKDTNLAKESLYIIHWDEAVTPVVTRLDQRFSTYFRIKEEANNEWRVFVRWPLRSMIFPVKAAEFSSNFGPFKDSLKCTVTIRHFIIDEDSEDQANGRSSSYFDKKIKKAQGASGSSGTSLLSTQQESGKGSTTSSGCRTTEFMTVEKDVRNYTVAVGVLGGLLGLALIVGISVGLYYNYKKSSRLGLFRRRPPQTISLLGQAYPNIAMSNTDMRLNSRDAYEPSSTSYPDYGFANPAATEDAPPAYTPEII